MNAAMKVKMLAGLLEYVARALPEDVPSSHAKLIAALLTILADEVRALA